MARLRHGTTWKTAWSTIDQADNPRRFVEFMDTFNGADGQPEQYPHVSRLLDVRTGQRILDVGCGTGGAARGLARMVGPTGRVVGVDISATMIAQARQRAAGLDLPVEYREADAHQLPFADNTFDGAFSTETFALVDDPRRALAEMARVTRPGGRIYLIGDVSWAFDAADAAVTRRLVEYVWTHELNGDFGAQLPRLCREVGLIVLALEPVALVGGDFPTLYTMFFDAFIAGALSAGALSAREAEEWVADQQRRYEAGDYFFCTTHVRVMAFKP